MNQRSTFAFVSLLLISLGACGQAPDNETQISQVAESSISKAEFDRLLDEISNWGRWGDDDQLGTLNLITPAKRREAASEVRSGVTVSLSLNVSTQQSAFNRNPLQRELFRNDLRNPQTTSDRFDIRYHGYAYSHIDGLQHVAYQGQLYNGVLHSEMIPDGMEALGVQNIGVDGIFSRGVLVDMPIFFGVEYLEPDAVITIDDLRAWEESSGITVQSGDVILIRTGRWARFSLLSPMPDGIRLAGVHPEVAAWLREKDVAVIGTDGVLDVEPPLQVEGLEVLPLHTLVLVGLGMPILDNLDLEAVAEYSQRIGRSTFLFTAAPLRVPGGTGSPMNPLAVF